MTYELIKDDISNRETSYKFWIERLQIVQEKKLIQKAQGFQDENLTMMSEFSSVKYSESDS